jgi:hypothetical protein
LHLHLHLLFFLPFRAQRGTRFSLAKRAPALAFPPLMSKSLLTPTQKGSLTPTSFSQTPNARMPNCMSAAPLAPSAHRHSQTFPENAHPKPTKNTPKRTKTHLKTHSRIPYLAENNCSTWNNPSNPQQTTHSKPFFHSQPPNQFSKFKIPRPAKTAVIYQTHALNTASLRSSLRRRHSRIRPDPQN